MPTNDTTGRARRYEEIEVANGDVVIYDTDNHRAWIQSDGAVTPDEMA